MALAKRSKTIAAPDHISWSSLSTWVECGEKWRLKYGYHAEKSTWYATIAGAAIHEITESYDKGNADNLPSFVELFSQKIDDAMSEGVEVKPSGRATKNMCESGGPNKKDRAWWYHYGPIYVQRWINWRNVNTHYTIADIDGVPGIEYAIRYNIGGIDLVGYADRIMQNADTGDMFILDLKTGAIPASTMQLQTYRLGLKQCHGIDVNYGMFWTPQATKKEASPSIGYDTEMINLSNIGVEAIRGMYTQAVKGIRSNVFIPHVTPMCHGCPVKNACWAVGGADAKRYPTQSMITNNKEG